MRICSKCNEIKLISCFYTTKQGYKTQCKVCIKEIEKSRRDSNYNVIKYRQNQSLKESLFKKNKLKCSKCFNIKDINEYAFELKGWKKLRSDCNQCKNKRIQEYNLKTNSRNMYMKKYLSDTSNRLADNLRSRLRKAIKNNQKTGSAVDDLGCSIEELKIYLESQFQDNMSWDNYGLKGWHIDHIIPLASFDLTIEEEFKKACHYTNLQPLWAKDNLIKGAKHDE